MNGGKRKVSLRRSIGRDLYRNKQAEPSYLEPPRTSTISLKQDDANKFRKGACRWHKKLVNLSGKRIKELEEQIQTMEDSKVRTGRDKRGEDDPYPEREHIAELRRYWKTGRNKLRELTPAEHLVDALTVLIIRHSFNGLDQANRVASQEVRLSALKEKLNELRSRLGEVEGEISAVKRELSESSDRTIEHSMTSLWFGVNFKELSEVSDE